MSGSTARSTIEVLGSSEYSEESGSDTQGDEAMSEPLADESQVEVPCTRLKDEDEGEDVATPIGPGDGDGSSQGSPGEAVADGARFRGGSRGPLGALAIVNNKQVLLAQAREAEDLLQSLGVSDGQASMADDYCEWASLEADVDRLTKDKDELREYVKKTTEKVELRHSELEEWTAKLSAMADVGSHRLVSIRDMLPPNLGPAVMRLATLYLRDDDSVDKLPDRYKHLLGKDVQLLAQKKLPPAPSQDVTVLRKELASARGSVEAMRRDLSERDNTIRTLESGMGRETSAKERLETKIKNLRERYDDASRRMGQSFIEKDREISEYNHKCKGLYEDQKRLRTMLVRAEEEKERLSGHADNALRSVEQKDARIKELDESVKVLTAVEEGSRPALDALKESVKFLREQHQLTDRMNTKLMANMQDKAQSEQEHQQRKITQLEDDITKLKRENGRARQLEREKQDLQQQATDLAGRNETLSAEAETMARRDRTAREEKRALEEKVADLEVTIGDMQARFDELNVSHGKLQASEASLSSKVHQLKDTIRENDSARDVVVRHLRDDVDSWEAKCEELRARNKTLEEDAQTAERAINNAQLQVAAHTQVSAELSWHRRMVESLEREKEDGRIKLEAAEAENKRLEARLEVSAAQVEALRAEAQLDKDTIHKSGEEKARGREKIRGLEDRLRNADLELTNRETVAASRDQQLKGKEDQVAKLLEDVTKLMTSEEENKKSLALEQGNVRRLQAQLSDAERSLDTERRRATQLGKDKEELSASISAQRAEASESNGALQRSLEDERTRAGQLVHDIDGLKRSLSEQKRQADDAQRELSASNDKERDRAQQLQGTVTELKESVKSLQDQKVVAARESGALEASLQRETAERKRFQELAKERNTALDRLKETHQAQLRWGEAQVKTQLEARQQLVAEVGAHKAQAERTDGEMAQLATQLRETRGLLAASKDQAQESVKELQGFLSRLCLAPPGDQAVLEGLARQLQSPGALEAQEPASGPSWVILETWGDDANEEVIQIPEGLEMLVLELFRTAVAEHVDSRKCHLVLQKAAEAVSAGTVIHTGVFGEMAKVFAQAVTARPEEGFETGLVLWQLLGAVQQRWGTADLNTVRDDLESSLRAHEYGSLFEVVATRAQFQQCDDCHFFSDTSAVFARVAHPRAALINVQEQSIRFFSKARLAHGLRGCTIRPPGDHPAVLLRSNSVHDTIWADKMF